MVNIYQAARNQHENVPDAQYVSDGFVIPEFEAGSLFLFPSSQRIHTEVAVLAILAK